MSAASIDERGDSAAVNKVQAPTLQREAVVREIVHWKCKLNFAVKPLFHGLLIVGSDTSYVARLQRVLMRLDNFLGKFGLIVVAAKLGTYFPSDYRDE
jgi:hypothetical protein